MYPGETRFKFDSETIRRILFIQMLQFRTINQYDIRFPFIPQSRIYTNDTRNQKDNDSFDELIAAATMQIEIVPVSIKYQFSILIWRLLIFERTRIIARKFDESME